MSGDALVVSISRTRDPLKERPDWLAAVLRGDAPVRLARAFPPTPLDLEALGAIVLWTKDPRALADHAGLRAAIEGLRARGVALALQLTVTGLGGTPVEPGIPAPPTVRAALARALDAGALAPGAIKLRVDPLIGLRDPHGQLWSNASVEACAAVIEPFAALGVARVTASRAQVTEYPRVARRLARLGLVHEEPDDAQGRALTRDLAAWCADRGLRYSTCVVPADASSLVEGCIDGAWLNALLAAQGSPKRVTAQLHNARGRQRPDCRCTFSYDLGASPHVGHCYDAGTSWCAYCYSAPGGTSPPPG